MRPDVPLAHGTEKGIDERVQQHIGVRMAHQPYPVRDFDSAENQFSSPAESVNIKSMSDTKLSGHILRSHISFEADRYLCHELQSHPGSTAPLREHDYAAIITPYETTINNGHVRGRSRPWNRIFCLNYDGWYCRYLWAILWCKVK